MDLGKYRAAAVLRMIALIGVLACADLPRTNPVDPMFPLDIQIRGPDTLGTRGRIYEFAIETDPPWPKGGPIEWKVSEPTLQLVEVHNLGSGRFRLDNVPGGLPYTLELTVRAGAHRASKAITVMQIPARVEFRACASGSCVVSLSAPFGAVYGIMKDSAGHVTGALPPDLIDHVRSSAPDLLTIQTATVGVDGLRISFVANLPGSTFIVVDKYASDSIAVIIEASPQVPAHAPAPS